MNDKNKGGLQDLDRGIRLLKQASKDGSDEAAYRLGLVYWTGSYKQAGKDQTEAVKWFELADKQGNEWAGHLLAQAYLGGLGVPKNVRKAITYYAKHSSSQEGRNWYKLLSGSHTVSNHQLDQALRWMLACDREHRSQTDY